VTVERIGRLWTTLEGVHPAFGSEAFRQLVRYVAAGLGVTLFSVLVYSAAATLLHVRPLLANSLSWICGVGVGYAVHSRWSFAADKDKGEGVMVVRFLMASGFALALNSFWVWVATGLLHLPPLAPVPAMMFVTPLASFLLNRYWVFEAA